MLVGANELKSSIGDREISVTLPEVGVGTAGSDKAVGVTVSYTEEFIDLCRDLFNSPTSLSETVSLSVAVAVSEQDSSTYNDTRYTKLETLADILLTTPHPSSSTSPSTPSSSSSLEERFHLSLSNSSKSWVALLTAKIFLCCVCDHQTAYKWVRRALTLVAPRSHPDSNKTRRRSGGRMSVDKCLPRIEVSLTLMRK